MDFENKLNKVYPYGSSVVRYKVQLETNAFIVQRRPGTQQRHDTTRPQTKCRYTIYCTVVHMHPACALVPVEKVQGIIFFWSNDICLSISFSRQLSSVYAPVWLGLSAHGNTIIIINVAFDFDWSLIFNIRGYMSAREEEWEKAEVLKPPPSAHSNGMQRNLLYLVS